MIEFSYKGVRYIYKDALLTKYYRFLWFTYKVSSHYEYKLSEFRESDFFGKRYLSFIRIGYTFNSKFDIHFHLHDDDVSITYGLYIGKIIKTIDLSLVEDLKESRGIYSILEE